MVDSVIKTSISYTSFVSYEVLRDGSWLWVNCGFAYITLLFCQFVFYVFDTLLLGAETFRIIMSSWRRVPSPYHREIVILTLELFLSSEIFFDWY